MKNHLKKINQIGATHLVAPLIVTVLIAAVGVYVLNKSRAATLVRTTYSSTPVLFSTQDYTNPAKAVYSIKTVTAEGTSPLTQAEQTSDKYWLSDGKYDPAKSQIAYAETQNGSVNSRITVKPLNRVGIAPPRVFSNGIGNVENFIWSPDGKRIIYSDPVSLGGNLVGLKALNPATGTVTLLATISTLESGVAKWVGRISMLGDNQTVVYELGQGGIYAVKSGSTPYVVHGGGDSCQLVGSRPGTAMEVAYTCYNQSAQRTTLYSKADTNAEKVIYASPAANWTNGATNTYVEKVAWSHDGAKLALQRTVLTVVDTATCKWTYRPDVNVINADGKNLQFLTYTDVLKTHGPGCGGMGGASFGNVLAWNKGGGIALVTDAGVKVIGATSPYSLTTVFKRPNNTTYINNLDW